MPIDQPPAIVEIVEINHELGGNICDHLLKYDDYRERGVKVRITGVCLSACTLVTSLPEKNVCVTADARLAFHQATHPNGDRSEVGTHILIDAYPSWVRSWIASQGHAMLGPGYMVMGTKELTQHYAVCPSGEVAQE